MADFAALLTEQIPRLRRYARALAGTQGADDLVQDSLERAWS
ncbi:MAG: RNA polymerase sigma factor, partial [Candidatus Competibacter denitrificans]